MRQLSAAMLKGRRAAGPQLPGEGTKTRLVYDVLYEHRGRSVPWEELAALRDLVDSKTGRRGMMLASVVADLTNVWGCDVLVGYKSYTLLGEWCGKIYIDYTSAAVEQAGAVR